MIGRPGNMDAWNLDLTSGALTRLTSTGDVFSLGPWSTDSRRLRLNQSPGRPVLEVVPGTGAVRELAGRLCTASDWSPDGRTIVCSKVDAGILEVIMRELEVECLPGDIPERIEVDVTDLGLHGAIRVSELKVSDKVKVLDDADQIVVHVVSVKEEAAPVAAAPAEGEAAAPAATPAEPEVMKKGKKEEEPAE